MSARLLYKVPDQSAHEDTVRKFRGCVVNGESPPTGGSTAFNGARLGQSQLMILVELDQSQLFRGELLLLSRSDLHLSVQIQAGWICSPMSC